MGEALVCRCKRPKLYYMSSAVTNKRTGKITPVFKYLILWKLKKPHKGQQHHLDN